MPTRARPLPKAELQEITFRQDQEPELGEHRIEVQFNPESLKLNFANQTSGNDQRGGAASQHVGQGTSKLAFDLWFDASVTATGGAAASADVRRLTREVRYFLKARDQGSGTFVPPAVRFSWGSFRFDGIMDSLNETLDFFSDDGRPLRAMLAVSLSQQEIMLEQRQPATPGGLPAAGTRPQTRARQGDSLQSLAALAGKQDAWQQIAAANGVDNPRRLAVGAPLDLSLPRRAR